MLDNPDYWNVRKEIGGSGTIEGISINVRGCRVFII
jgi:hypothetical protein